VPSQDATPDQFDLIADSLVIFNRAVRLINEGNLPLIPRCIYIILISKYRSRIKTIPEEKQKLLTKIKELQSDLAPEVSSIESPRVLWFRGIAFSLFSRIDIGELRQAMGIET